MIIVVIIIVVVIIVKFNALLMKSINQSINQSMIEVVTNDLDRSC